MVDARLPTGERVNVIIPPLALNGPTLTIRRFPRRTRSTSSSGSAPSTRPPSRCCGRCVAGRSTSSSPAGPARARRRCSTRSRPACPTTSGSSRSRTPPSCSSSSRTSSRWRRARRTSREAAEVTIRDLVRNSLRMRPDRIIVGEVRGGETLDMLQAMNTGHEGSLATVHANSTDDAILRLETLAHDERAGHPVRRAARPDQLRDRRDRAARPLPRRRAARSRRSRSSPRSAARSSASQTLARFEMDPMGPDARVTGRFLHHALPAWHRGATSPAGRAAPPRVRRGGPPSPARTAADAGASR